MNKVRSRNMPYMQGQNALNFFITAYEDYIAARQLLINDLLIQGCILANTSIEKYFKGMKAILGEEIPMHHNITVRKFKNTLRNKFTSIYELINFEFLEFLANCYKLRYFDEIECNFSIAIIRTKTLAELDFIVGNIENSFSFREPGMEAAENRFTLDKNEKNPKLWDFNHTLHGINKQHYIEKPDRVYEFRKLHNGQIIQFYYVTDQIKNDGQFIYEAFKPKPDDPKSFSLCFTPLSQKS